VPDAGHRRIADGAGAGEPEGGLAGRGDPSGLDDWRNAVAGGHRDERLPRLDVPGTTADAREADVG
jgi:hypothetical protein